MAIPAFIHSPDPTIYISDNFLVLDLETTNKDKGSALNPENRLLLAVWYYGNYKISWGNEYQHEELLQDISKADFIVAHNAKFELQWLQRMGVPIEKILPFDTMIAEKVLAGNLSPQLNLGSISSRRGYGRKDPYVDICIKSGICPSELPKELVEKRCKLDVWQTKHIFQDQLRELITSDKLRTLFTRCIFTPVLADIETNGLYLDCERVIEEFNKEVTTVVELRSKLDKLTGGINPKSPPQVAKFLYGELGFKEKTRRGKPIRNKPTKQFPDGQPLTDEATILSLKPKTQRQKDFLKLKKAYTTSSAALSKNLEFFYGVCKEYNGIFYGVFNQTVAATHRLSSSGRSLIFSLFDKAKAVQLQNLPRRYKPLFKPRNPNWLYLEPDGAQLEFRTAAQLGQDVQAIQDIVNGVDVHTFTAETITAAGQSTSRQEAKAHTFKPLYGGEYGTKAEMEYYAAFKDKYPGIAAAQEQWQQEVIDYQTLKIPTGIEFYWPKVNMATGIDYRSKHQICNYPVQSFATADIIPIAVTKLWHELKDRKCNSIIVNTIHDSSPMEVDPEEKDLVRELAIEAYTHYVYKFLEVIHNIKFVVPLGIGLKFGRHWGEGEEEKLQISPPYKLAGVNYG